MCFTGTMLLFLSLQRTISTGLTKMKAKSIFRREIRVNDIDRPKYQCQRAVRRRKARGPRSLRPHKPLFHSGGSKELITEFCGRFFNQFRDKERDLGSLSIVMTKEFQRDRDLCTRIKYYFFDIRTVTRFRTRIHAIPYYFFVTAHLRRVLHYLIKPPLATAVAVNDRRGYTTFHFQVIDIKPGKYIKAVEYHAILMN